MKYLLKLEAPRRQAVHSYRCYQANEHKRFTKPETAFIYTSRIFLGGAKKSSQIRLFHIVYIHVWKFFWRPKSKHEFMLRVFLDFCLNKDDAHYTSFPECLQTFLTLAINKGPCCSCGCYGYFWWEWSSCALTGPEMDIELRWPVADPLYRHLLNKRIQTNRNNNTQCCSNMWHVHCRLTDVVRARHRCGSIAKHTYLTLFMSIERHCQSAWDN